MKRIYSVNNSKDVLGTLEGLKSRISSLNSRIWTVIAPMLFVAFGLLGVNENAWATWPTYSGSCSTSGYVLNDACNNRTSALTTYEFELNLAGPGDELTFKAKITDNSVGTNLKIYQYVGTGYQDTPIFDRDKPGKWQSGILGRVKNADYDTYTVSVSALATKIKFVFVGSLNKNIRDVSVTRYSDNAYALYNDSLDCGSADYNAANSSSNYTTGTAYVDWSHIATAPTCSISGSQASYFEVKTKTNTPTTNTYGVMSIEVAYKHTAPGDHSATLNVGGKTITITGHTNKITPYIDTTPTVDTITYGQTIGNSQLHGGLVKADLINNTGATVAGTWTIDEAGNTISTSGGQNTTVNLTFTPSDQNTYNVLHTTQTMFVRSASTISWASAYSAEKPTIPVGKTIENAASTNANGATVTYSTPNTDIIAIENEGTTFRAIAEGEATITASHGVTATHGSASISKTFKTTYKDIQVIVWTDRFDRLTTEMTSKNLLAQVWIENPSTGVRTYSAARTALLEYSVEDNTVVSIPNNSTTLTIHKKGNTTITASVEGNDQYESASVTMVVKVREPSAGCDDPLLLDIKNNGTNDYLYRLFSDDTKKPALYTDEYAINVAQGQVPDKLSFAHKGEEYKVVGLSFWTYYSGTIKAQQKVNGDWIDVPNSSVTPEKSKWNTIEGLQLDEKATHIRFVRPQGGEGYHYVRNVEVTMKHFIRTATPTVDFGNTIKVNSSEYQDVVVKYSNVKDALQVVNPFTSDVTVSDEVIDVDSCGAFGSATLRISFSPTTATEIDDYIVVKDPIVGNSSALSIRVKADVQRADQTITWNPATSISTIDQILLNGTTNGQEYGQMNVIGYEVTNNDGVISVTNNVVTILKPGTVTITASQNGSANYEAADPVEKNFTISAEPLTLVAPTAQGITYGQALSESELSGGSAKDSKGNDVGGTFAWETASIIPNASDEAQAFAVVFTPSENAEWYTNLTTDANVNVAKADPAATVENVSFAYGTKAEDVALDGTGDGEWSWDDERANQTLNVGVYNDVAVKFTPNDGDNYNVLSTTITLTVTKADPVAAANAVEITYGATASSVELSGTGVAGTWSWTDDSKDDVLDANTYTMDVHFVPTDAANYNEKDATVALTVNKATSVATPTASAITAGQEVSASVLANSGTAGTWAWDEAVANTKPAVGTYNYTVHFTPDNANYTTLTTTVSLQVNALVNEFTNAAGDGDWSNDSNWSSGSKPAEADPDVIVSGQLIIDNDVTVGNLTIKPEGGVTVITNGTLTVNGSSADQSGYGDLYVRNGGEVEVAGNLRVGDLVVEASIGTSIGNAKSGQVANAENIVYTNAYIDINMDPSGVMDDTKWYGFTVPFAVNAHNGVSRKVGSTYQNCNYGTDYIIAEYDAAKRLSSGKGWKYLSGNTLNAGQFYYFGGDGGYNTYRFKASGNIYTPVAEKILSMNGTGADANWNAVGNSTLQHAKVSFEGGNYVQVYQNGLDAYKTVATSEATFVVGCPFFIQASENATLALSVPTDASEKYYAPRRSNATQDGVARVNLTSVDGGYSDQIYVSGTEKENDEYVLGHDLSKAGLGTAIPQLWLDAYGQKLSVHEAVWQGENALCQLGIYAPKEGEYILTATQPENGTQVYLTIDGMPVWNISEADYVLSLEKGTMNNYGLMLIQASRMPTDVENVEAADGEKTQKIILNDHLYILRDSRMYDVTGKKVK